ncbi:MAG: HAD family hydrolase [Rhodospirillaceae bacterium]|jgi:HAD superfamily hydrolase (TIGR01509 family)|nr:HAD family hydrolase [Rhodospirillaceae bacterium]MBT6137901.1 HAD family hydrolase [Rhodospirillaceae bacterium]
MTASAIVSGSPRLVIFDCDGVLVDSEPIANRIRAEALTEEGWVIDFEDAMRQFKGGKLSEIQREAEERLGRSLGEGWLDRIYAMEFEVYRRELEPIPGVVDALDALDRAGIRYCVASNGPLAKMKVTLGSTGLLDRFNDRLFSANMVERPKPAPDLFLHAARKCGVPPADCIVVEDSPTGAKAAIAAEIPVYGYTADTPASELTAIGVRRTFAAMGDLPALLSIN